MQNLNDNQINKLYDKELWIHYTSNIFQKPENIKIVRDNFGHFVALIS